MTRARSVLAWFLLAGLALPAPSLRAAERILDYHSDVQVAADGSMTVAENIVVVAEGDAIRHGIYRDFPTDYRDAQHNRYRVDFTVLDASLDAAPVAWRSERRDNGVRIYLGDGSQDVSPGQHHYVIRYRTTRQLGFFADHDELYWNVTGAGWDFPIGEASATLHLPVNVPAAALRAYGYTGAAGSRAQDLAVQLLADGARYTTTHPLGPHENLSVVLEFPKRIIAEPGRAQRFAWLLHDNRSALVGLLGLLVLWLYYGWAWTRFGRDPASQPLVARYDPPDGDSAAALRYVRDMGYDNLCFTAGVLDLAARGRLSIEQDVEGTYTLVRSTEVANVPLPRDASRLLATLFAAGGRVVLKDTSHTVMGAARSAHKAALALDYEKKYFLTNRGKLLPGLAISLVTLFVAVRGGSPEAWGMLVWLSFWSLAVFVLLGIAVTVSRGSGWRGILKSLGIWLFALPFVAGEIAGLVMFGRIVGYAMLPVFVVLIGTNIAFYHWMKAPTRDGARRLDGIQGFRWYLGVAEKQELDSRYRPESKPELFAAYLPYALALDVGNAWADRFAQALSPAQMQAAAPSWYHGGPVDSFNAAGFKSFASSLGSGMSNAIAASSTAPGSSSGRGGSSGGGGGGGGGGGW